VFSAKLYFSHGNVSHNVRNLTGSDRSAAEQLAGDLPSDDQRIVIQVEPRDVPPCVSDSEADTDQLPSTYRGNRKFCLGGGRRARNGSIQKPQARRGSRAGRKHARSASAGNEVHRQYGLSLAGASGL
jgi:hypothetical protein